jgi:epoxyqueuosine reductase
LVRPREVASVVPHPAGGSDAGAGALAGLRGPRFLKPDLRQRLEARARDLGFDLCRVAAPDAIPLAPERLASWLAEGAQGDMDWMAETQARRADPRVLWPDVRSVILLAMNYGPEEDPLAALTDPRAANISVYARHRDYHDVMKGRLKQLASWLLAETGGGDVKVFVDTAPVMEKPLAQAAGLGWQGRHTNLVSRSHGSWLFLGSIFTTLDLPRDAPEVDHCGSCHACLDACPTQAFPAPYRLDARRCISYLTIEHKGHIAPEFRAPIGNRIYGCDDCLAACPWNKFVQAAREAKLQARDDLRAPRLADLVRLDEAGFRALFSGSPVKRVGHVRFLRNVLIAIGNSGDTDLTDAVRAHLDHASPLVRAMAVWALSRLVDRVTLRDAAARWQDAEPDAAVRDEWQRALST